MTLKIASLAAGAALLALAPAAHAADMPIAQAPVEALVPVDASFDWTGFYVGVYGGYGWGEVDAGVDDDVDGGLAGGTVGYNIQSGNFVYGIEADGGWAGLEDDTAGVDVDLNWTATVRGRIGYAMDSFLVYATGGAAIGELEVDAGILGDDSDTRLGYTVGAGVEAALTDNISAKVEYLYVDLGDDDLLGVETDFDAHTVKGGINYRF